MKTKNKNVLPGAKFAQTVKGATTSQRNARKKHVRVTRNNETDTSDEHDSSEEWLNAVSSRKSSNDSSPVDQRPERQIPSEHGS